MFTAPRFVVIDDDPNHLAAIANNVQRLGSACAQVVYSPEVDPPKELFSAVRILFMDLQLRDRSASSDFKNHYAEIQRLLQHVIEAPAGPYLLVLWTDSPDRADELLTYLEKNLFPDAPHTRPVGIVPLSKNDFISAKTGAETSEGLLAAILELLEEQPAMSALLLWESEVVGAASLVLADIVTLAGELAQEKALANLLRTICVSAVGGANVELNPRSSLQAALLPLLQDHLQNGEYQSESWSSFFDDAMDSGRTLTKRQVTLLNTKFHVTRPDGSQPIAASEWGAISTLETNMDWGEFDLQSAEQFVQREVSRHVGNLSAEQIAGTDVVQIRVGAACDYAQKASGPIPYVLAALLPGKTDEVKRHKLASNATCWLSPEVDLGGGPVQIFVDPRFVRVRGPASTAEFTPIARIKEQLLLALVATIGHHNMRPGITSF